MKQKCSQLLWEIFAKSYIAKLESRGRFFLPRTPYWKDGNVSLMGSLTFFASPFFT